MLRTTSATMFCELILCRQQLYFIVNQQQLLDAIGRGAISLFKLLSFLYSLREKVIFVSYILFQKMMQQVQMTEEQVFQVVTDRHNTREFLTFLKGFVIGSLGVPLSHCKIQELMGMIDIYEDWLDMGTISRQNAISLFLNSLKKMESPQKRSSNSQDQTNSIIKFQEYVGALVERVIEDEDYFLKPPKAYNPKEEILMSLNFTQNQCPICSQIMDPEQAVILDCTHVYHFQCLYEHVKSSIENGQLSIRCPSEYCGIELGQDELMNFMTNELERKRQEFMLNQYVERNGESTSWCPTPDCNFLFEFHPSITDFSCRNCHKRYCLRCRCDFHQGMTCTEYREYMGMSPDDQSFLNFARGARFKQCPRCRFWVEKSVGCVTMKCRCNQEFCYACGGVTCPHGRCSKDNANPPLPMNWRT